MSQKPNPTLIGLFLVLGTALLTGGVLLLTSARWFEHTTTCILYFDASVRGLSPGAPVKFRGVTIGAVREILIRHNQAPEDLHMPVIVDINADQLNRKTDQSMRLDDPSWCDEAIAKGLRGMLASESLVTGQLYVELEVLRGAPPPTLHQLENLYPEIPTVPTDIQVLLANLAKLDLAPLLDRLGPLLDKLDTLIASVPVESISRSLTNLLDAGTAVVGNADLTNTFASAHAAFQRVQLLADSMDQRVAALTEKADRPLDEAAIALAEFRVAIQDLRGLLAADAPLRTDLLQALDQLSRAAQSVGDLADSLKRNPDSLIKGVTPTRTHP